IWGNDAGTVEATRAAVAGLSMEAQTFVFPESPDETLAALNWSLAEDAPDVLIDTTDCGTTLAFASAEPEAVGAAIARAADCRFVAWQRLAKSKHLPGRVLVVTAIDGAHGLSDSPHALNPIFGLYTGFYKSLRKAFPDCLVVVLDIDPQATTDAFAPVLAELAGRGPGVEICYRAGQRHRVVLANALIPAYSTLDPAGGYVIVATGGGSGITATIVKRLVAEGPGCQVALIGRTPLGPDTERFHGLSPEARLAEKEAIAKRLAAKGKRVTPVMIQKAYASLERAAEIHDTLAELSACGCPSTYHAADVCDLDAMESVLTEVRRVHGPITTLIHGAGLEMSRPLDKKSLAEFQSVHRVKTLGAYNLGWLCRREPLRRVVAISSIAGRLGSPAQVDYSAANAFLDLWARMFNRQGVHGRSLIWSGWAEQGMAWKNTFLRENAETAGLNFIPPTDGAAAAVREIFADGNAVEVVLHLGLGGLVDPDLAAGPPAQYPFVDHVVHRTGQSPSVWRRFSPQRDALLDQHRLAGTSLMPGVGFMEMMAETHGLLTGASTGAHVFRKLEFLDAFKLYRDKPRDVQIRTAAGEGSSLAMEVWSPFHSQAGTALENRLYCRALLSREVLPLPTEDPTSWDLGGDTVDDYSSIFALAATFKHNVMLGPILNEARREGHSKDDLGLI
ncbi:MAG TPA: SDR family oxidoreductase, partial [Polyangia bacterium]